MLIVRHFNATPLGLEDQGTGTQFLWTDLESIDVPVTWRFSVRGMRPACTVILGFNRGRRCQIGPPRATLTGRSDHRPIERLLRHAVAAAPVDASVAYRAKLMAALEEPDAPPILASLSAVEQLVLKAEAAFARLDYRAATRTIGAAQQLEPHNLRLLWLNAWLAIEKELPGHTVVERLRPLKSHAPTDPEPTVLIALAFLLNDWSLPPAQIEELKSMAPRDRFLGVAFAAYLRRRERLAEAAEVLRALYAQSPHSTVKDAAAAELGQTEREVRSIPTTGWGIASKWLFKIGPMVLGGLGICFLIAGGILNSTAKIRRTPAARTPVDPHPPEVTGTYIPAPPDASAEAERQVEEADRLLRNSPSSADLARARRLLAGAAAAGNQKGMIRYAIMCNEELGGPRDAAEAERFFRLSASDNEPTAMALLSGFLAAKDDPADRQFASALLSRRVAAGGMVPAEGGAPSPPPPPRPTTFPTKDDHFPTAYYQVRPNFPAELRMLGLSGQAVVEFIVDEDGTVTNVHAISGTFPAFEASAVECVKHWLFIPAVKGGKAVSTRMRIPMIFSVEEGGPATGG